LGKSKLTGEILLLQGNIIVLISVRGHTDSVQMFFRAGFGQRRSWELNYSKVKLETVTKELYSPVGKSQK